MQLYEVLHDEDECRMSQYIVASHNCMDDHYIITWEPNKQLEIWYLNDRGEWVHEDTRTDSIANFEEAQEEAEAYFEDWLDSLGDQE